MAPGADEAGRDAVDSAARLKRWAKPFLAVIGAVFVAKAAWDLASRWDGSTFALRIDVALLALAPLLASCFAQGIAWIGLVEKMAGRRVARVDAMALYLASQLARYTPGKVGLPLVRMQGAPAIGLARGLAGVSVLVEMVSWTATGALAGLLLLALTSRTETDSLLSRFSWSLFALSLAGTLALLTVDRRQFPNALRRFLALEGGGPLVPARLPAAQLAYWALVAAHGALLTSALGASPHMALGSASFYVIASVAGFVVLAAPGGLGVREAVLVSGLTPALGPKAALGAALFSRGLWLLAEIGTWLLTRRYARKYGASHATTP